MEAVTGITSAENKWLGKRKSMKLLSYFLLSFLPLTRHALVSFPFPLHLPEQDESIERKEGGGGGGKGKKGKKEKKKLLRGRDNTKSPNAKRTAVHKAKHQKRPPRWGEHW